MTYILHINTSSKNATIMLARDGKVCQVKENVAERDHATTINILIDACMQEEGITLNDISALAICTGPGSYTGLRVGMATVKGIAYAIDKPIIAHHKHELLLGNVPIEDRNDYAVLIPAREGEYFWYNTTMTIPQHATTMQLTEELLKPYIRGNIVGNVQEDIEKCLSNEWIENDQINISYWAFTSFEKFLQQKFENIATVEPLYIKEVFIQKKI